MAGTQNASSTYIDSLVSFNMLIQYRIIQFSVTSYDSYSRYRLQLLFYRIFAKKPFVLPTLGYDGIHQISFTIIVFVLL